MECEFERVDPRIPHSEQLKIGKRNAEILFRLNHTMPMTDEYQALLRELFGDNLGEGSSVYPPLMGVCFENIKIGRNVFINSNLLAMARGGVVIEDNVQIAANVQLLTNNHDPYDRAVLLCKPIHIKNGAWIGAGATILPGVCVGEHAIVGASSVVTKDVPDYAVVVGNPAKIVKMLEADKFEK